MNHQQRDILIQQLLDGEIGQEEFEALQNLLLQDPEARRRFYEYAGLHQALSFGGVPGRGERQKLGPLLRSAQQRRVLRQTAVGAAAAVVIGLLALRLAPTPDSVPPGTLRTSEGSVFSVAHDARRYSQDKPPAPGTFEIGSSLELKQGTAELTLACGATAIARAPTKLVVRDEDKIFLDHGTVWFRVEKEARGFQVLTDDLKVTDLGTEFGVIASKERLDEVHCFKGRVLAEGRNLKAEEKILAENQAFETDPLGRLASVKPRPEEFLQSLPSGPAFLHWSFDTLEAGGFHAEGTHPAAGRPVSRFAASENASMPAMVTGRFGQAVRFGGNADLLTDWPGILGSAPRSVAVWVKVPPDQKSDMDILSWGTRLWGYEGANLKFKLGFSEMKEGLRPVVSFGGTRYIAIEADIVDGNWHHLVCVYRGGTLGEEKNPVSLYVDGITHPLALYDDTDAPDPHGRYQVNTLKRTPLVVAAGLSASANSIIIDESRFHGDMDEIYIFDNSIDEDMIQSLYQGNHNR